MRSIVSTATIEPVPLELTTPVKYIKRIGDRVAANLAERGVETVEDLLYHLPFRYEDRQNPRSLDELKPGDPIVITRYLYKPTAAEGNSHFNDNKRLHIFVVDVATGKSRQLTNGVHYEHSIDWSPDGREIAYISNRAQDDDQYFNYDLFTLSPATGETRQVTATESAEYRPHYSPDGKSIVYEATKRGLKPMGRIVSWGIAGVEPKLMGRGPVPATKIALQKAGLTLDYIDLIEVNEAFAAQYLAVEKELGLDRNKVNVNGGAIALGHPLGATGTRLVITLLYELHRRKKKYGLATACIGGGQGIAMIVESLN